MSFDIALSVVSVVTGLASIAVVARATVGAWLAERRKLKDATVTRFQRVLSSDNLSEIGSYLDDVIGQFEIREYVYSPKVSGRVDAYIEKLSEFLQTDAEVDAESKVAELPPPGETQVPAGDELKRIEQELREGEVWNALARLRRHIEIRLREVASRLEVRADQRTSAGRLVESLARAKVIDDVTRQRLRYAIDVCNTAVHGREVPLDAAETAVRQAATALGTLPTVTDLPARAYARAAQEIARPEGAGRPDRQHLWSQAQAHIATGNRGQGVELLEQVAELDLRANAPDVNVLNQLSGLRDQLGQYEDAVQWADIAIAMLPKDVGARFNKAVIEIHRGGSASEERGKRSHWRAALTSFDQARRLHEAGTLMDDVDYGKMWLFAGETAQYVAELGPPPEARTDWLQKAAAWYNEGYVWLLSAQSRATEDTAALVGFWLNNAHERTFRIHHVERQADSAGLQRKDVARLDNDIPFWRKEDEADFRKLGGVDEGRAEPRAAEGNRYFYSEEFGRALVAFDAAIRLRPQYTRAHIRRGLTLTRLERYEDATEAYNVAILQDDRNAQAYYNRGCVYALRDMPDHAITDLRKAVDLAPKYRGKAKRDPHLIRLHGDSRFRKLVGLDDESGEGEVPAQ